jgi:Xaa-Pro aminopeptidase
MKARLGRLRERLDLASCDSFLSLAAPTNQYLTGFRGSTSAVVVTQNEALFLCDFRYTEQAHEEVWSSGTGADGGYAVEEVSGNLQEAAGKRLRDLSAKTAAFEPDELTVGDLSRVQTHFDGVCTPSPEIVSRLRRIKSPEEVDRIRAAARLVDGVLADGLRMLALAPGITEQELAGWFEYEFRKRGAAGAAFSTIALFGPRTSLVHGEAGDRALAKGDVVLLDLGCRLGGYCSDLTRTYAYSTIPGDWFDEVYTLTLTAQKIALEAVRPGISCHELDAIARGLIAEAGYGEHFGHGLGHGVGIDVHEEPRVGKDSDVVIEEGMVITIEPGIYLPHRGGVRIEDLVVVTKDGCECLSSAPKELSVL